MHHSSRSSRNGVDSTYNRNRPPKALISPHATHAPTPAAAASLPSTKSRMFGFLHTTHTYESSNGYPHLTTRARGAQYCVANWETTRNKKPTQAILSQVHLALPCLRNQRFNRSSTTLLSTPQNHKRIPVGHYPRAPQVTSLAGTTGKFFSTKNNTQRNGVQPTRVQYNSRWLGIFTLRSTWYIILCGSERRPSAPVHPKQRAHFYNFPSTIPSWNCKTISGR